MSVRAIHTGARRYCWDRIAASWAAGLPRDMDEVAQLLRDPFTFCAGVRRLYAYEAEVRRATGTPPARDESADAPSGLAVSLLEAVLDEVERSVPDDFRTVDEARLELAEAARRARIITGWGRRPGPDGKPIEEVHEAVLDRGEREEVERARQAFIAFIQGVSPEDAAAHGPMPYRRVLNDQHVQKVQATCLREWDADPTAGGWFPLKRGDPPPGLLMVASHSFYDQFGADELREILRRRGVPRVWEITWDWPHVPAREMAISACCFVGSGSEAMWSSREVDWLVYASHEASITIAGEWLVAAVKSRWPNWQDALRENNDGYW